MKRSALLLVALAATALVASGCRQGPGHTQAASTLVGTTAGAIVGAAASPCNRGGGALVGGLLGMAAGSMVGEGLAYDQEVYGNPPCPPPRCRPCPPAPCGTVYDEPSYPGNAVIIRRGAPPPGPPPRGYYYAIPQDEPDVYYLVPE